MRQYSYGSTRVRKNKDSQNFRISLNKTFIVISALLYFGLVGHTKALPAFARQTGQSCVACHAGGQFPELTPYGRIFKLTGYTIGTQGNPFAAMVVADVTKNKSNTDSTSNTTIAPLNNLPIIDYGSGFIAGKVTDNLGGFVQITYSVYDKQDSNANTWQGHLGSDNTDLRYANRFISSNNDLIVGLSVNNNPGVQDVWNSVSAWGYPYVAPSGNASGFNGLPASTILDGKFSTQVAGAGAYAYLNKAIYIELTGYQTATGFWKFLSQGNKIGDPNHPLTYTQGISPYLRVAYTHDWNEQNIMIGLIAMNANVYALDPITNLPQFGPSIHYQDKGIDAQYQYLLDPHTVSAHLRFVRENINDDTGQSYVGPSRTNSIFAKITYTYRNLYGADIAYRSINGSPDSTAYASYTNTNAPPASPSPSSGSSNSNTPDTKLWTPEIFWLPVQNLRLGLQYNVFTQYLGTPTNYDGKNRNASDNNSAYLYAWVAF